MDRWIAMAGHVMRGANEEDADLALGEGLGDEAGTVRPALRAELGLGMDDRHDQQAAGHAAPRPGARAAASAARARRCGSSARATRRPPGRAAAPPRNNRCRSRWR